MTLLYHERLLRERLICLFTLLLLLLLPFLVWYLTSHSLSQKDGQVRAIQERILVLQKLASEQEQNRTLIKQFQNREPLYLQKQVEPLLLLQQEKYGLENDPLLTCLPQPKEKRERLAFLQSKDNRFSFMEGKVLHTNLFKETIEVQNRPVELDSADLERVLTLLESTSIPEDKEVQQIVQKRPLLIMESAEMERKNKAGRDVWLLKTKLIKRTFTEK